MTTEENGDLTGRESVAFPEMDRRAWRQQAEEREQERTRLAALFPPLAVTIIVRSAEEAATDVSVAQLWLEANTQACAEGRRARVEVERARKHLTIAHARHALASWRAELQRAGVQWADLAEVTPPEEHDYLDVLYD